jgi:hypothetical protein
MLDPAGERNAHNRLAPWGAIIESFDAILAHKDCQVNGLPLRVRARAKSAAHVIASVFCEAIPNPALRVGGFCNYSSAFV